MERLFMTKRNEFLLKINNRISNIFLAVAVFIGMLSNPVIANAASTIFCPECGKQIDANSKYCMFCACQIEQYLLKNYLIQYVNYQNINQVLLLLNYF